MHRYFGATAAALFCFTDLQLPYGFPGKKHTFEVHAHDQSDAHVKILPDIRQKLREYKPTWFYSHQFLFILASINIPSPEVTYTRVHRHAVTGEKGLICYDIVRS